VLASVRTFTVLGIDAHEVRVEADVRGGLPAFALVGLPDAAVRESRERVRAAIANSDFDFPNKRITANLAPADLPKAGPGFDLALAAAVLVASEQLPAEALDGVVVAGELALDGSIRRVPGTFSIARAAALAGAPRVAVAEPSAPEAALAGGIRVVPVRSLRDLEALGTANEPCPPEPLRVGGNGCAPSSPDLADLRGQPYLRRALELAAAGGHSLLMTGPPGAGKSMAAARLPSLLPPLDDPEIGEAVRIASACGRPLEPVLARRRPYRAPHHTISTAGLIGGGSPLSPGEVTLAHHGVLFLDEFPEFRRDALEALRQPAEEGRVLIARAGRKLDLPCRFQLVAAANPCPCGRGETSSECECPPQAVRHHTTKLSGALADRIDMLVAISQPGREALRGPPGERSMAVRGRVLDARERQRARLGPGRCNADMDPPELQRCCPLDGASESFLAALRDRAELLSGRSHQRLLRLARTIADLAGRADLSTDDVSEALALRRRGRR
jgi:magnesium chelatase family protein